MEKRIIIGGEHTGGGSTNLANIKSGGVIIVDMNRITVNNTGIELSEEQEKAIIESCPEQSFEYKALDPKLFECQLESVPMPRKSDSQP